MKTKHTTTILSVIIITAVFMVIMAVIFHVADYYMVQLTETSAVNNMKNTLDAKDKAVEEYFMHEEDILRQYSMIPDAKEFLLDKTNEAARERVQKYTDTLYASLKGWEGLYLADTETKVYVHSEAIYIGMTTRDSYGAKQLIASMYNGNDLYNAGVIVSPATGELLMSMYSPVFNGTEIIGYVGGGPYAYDLKERLDSMKVEGIETSKYAIVDVSTKTFLISHDAERMGQRVTEAVILDMISRVKESKSEEIAEYEYTDVNAEEYIVIYKYMPEYDWVITAIDTKENVYYLSRHNRKVMLAFGIHALAVFMFIAWFFVSRLTKVQDARKKADSENIAKSAFLANMSHEIRTPMNAVVGIADILMTSGLNAEQKKYVESIKESGTSLVYMINDILDYSKIESGNMTILPREYYSASMFRNLRMIIQNRIGEKNILLEFDIDDNMPSVLIGDDIRIKQILINLLNNAVKFTDEGRVALQVKTGKISGDEIEITYRVIDSGMGIAPENLEKIFESFKQVDTMRNREKEGTGLGLAICRQLVGLMGGKLNVESEYGSGTTFTCVLNQKVVDSTPMDMEAVSHSSEAVTEKHFTIPNARILVVDDNITNIVVAKGLIAPLRAQIDTASSGMEALAMAAIKKYDLIFMDHMMPGMDGIETIRQLRVMREFDNYYKEAAVVAFTANAMSEAHELFAGVGVVGFLAKPIDRKSMYDMIRKTIPKDLLKTE